VEFSYFFQIVILIDFAYKWNENWTSDEKNWKGPVLIVAFILFAGCIVLWTFYFIWFGGKGCDRNNFFIAWTIVVSVFFTILSISPKIERGGGLLPSAIVALYCTWLCWSGLTSDPSSCNSLNTQDTLHLILGLVIGALSIAYTGWNTATSNSLFGGEEAKPDEIDPEGEEIPAGKAQGAAAGIEKDSDKDAAGDKGDKAKVSLRTEEDEINDQKLAKRNFRFHMLMMCCAFYMAMLLTNWGSPEQQADSSSSTGYDFSVESVWIKFVTQWVTMITYVWSLIAPICCRNRDFS